MRCGLCSQAGTPSSSSMTCRRGTNWPCRRRAARAAADSGSGRGCRGAPAARHRRGDALCGVSRRRRLGPRSARLLRQQRRRFAVAPRRHGRRRASRGSCSRRPARCTASRARCRSSNRFRRSRSTPTARPSWSSSGRWRTSSAPHGVRWIALRYFNAAGAHPDGTIGEDHSPEIHLIPRAIEAATGGAPLQVFGDDYPTPDGTCLRDYIHVCDLADAHVCALQALEAGAASGAYNAGTGRPHSVRQVIDTVSRVVGAPVAGPRRPRRPGDPAVLYAASDRLQRELGWRPASPRSRGHRPRRLALASDPPARVPCASSVQHSTLMDPLLRLLRYAAPHRMLIAGATLAMLVYGAALGGAGLADQADHRRRPAPTSRRCSSSPSPSSSPTSSRALGGYFSSYLMDDLGHRVVMRLRNDLFRHLLDQSAAFFSRRTTGQLLSRINNDVGQVHRAVAETLGDLARESLALVGFAALLVYYDAGLALAVHDRRAAGDVSARPARPAAAHGHPAESGAARAHVARRRRSVHRPSHRQGVWRRGPRGGEVRARVAAAVSHQSEGDRRAVGAAAADGVSRRDRRSPARCGTAAARLR